MSLKADTSLAMLVTANTSSTCSDTCIKIPCEPASVGKLAPTLGVAITFTELKTTIVLSTYQ